MATKGRTSTTPQSVSGKQGSEGLRITNLAVGDAIAFLIFAIIGINSHKESLNIPHLLVTAAPFIVAWFLVAPFIGVFRRNVTTSPRSMAIRTALAWLAAWPIALLLRGLFVEHAIPQWTFMLVALISNLIILFIWRIPYAITKKLSR